MKTVLYTFMAEEKAEITLAAGEVILVLGNATKNGWVLVEKANQAGQCSPNKSPCRGYIPISYLGDGAPDCVSRRGFGVVERDRHEESRAAEAKVRGWSVSDFGGEGRPGQRGIMSGDQWGWVGRVAGSRSRAHISLFGRPQSDV